MGFFPITLFAGTAMFWALRDGKTEASNWRLVAAWIAGVVALHSATVTIIWFASTDWDNPDASLLGPVGEAIVAIATMGLSVGYALWLRRSAVIYLALIALPVMVLFWFPVFL